MAALIKFAANIEAANLTLNLTRHDEKKGAKPRSYTNRKRNIIMQMRRGKKQRQQARNRRKKSWVKGKHWHFDSIGTAAVGKARVRRKSA